MELKKFMLNLLSFCPFIFFSDVFMKVSLKMPKAYNTCYFKVVKVHAVNKP